MVKVRRVIPAAKVSIAAPHLQIAYTPAEGILHQEVKLAILHDLDAGWVLTGSEDAGAAAVGLSATTISAEPGPVCDEHIQAAYAQDSVWQILAFPLPFSAQLLPLFDHRVQLSTVT